MAKVFDFRLQRVLNFRQSVERQKKVELSLAQRLQLQEKEKLNHLQSQKEKEINTTPPQSDAPDKLDLHLLKVRNDYLTQLTEKIKEQSGRVMQAEKVVEKKREILLNARKDKKVLEILKDRYVSEYKKMKSQEESRLESEIALRMMVQKER